jgi:hypothetical protein
LAQLGLLAVAVNRTGDTTVAPFTGAVTVTPAAWLAAKAADTVDAPLTVTWQVPVPLQAPPQPEKVRPVPGVSVRVTWVLAAKVALQVVGQLMPVGLLLTVPLPVNCTVRE